MAITTNLVGVAEFLHSEHIKARLHEVADTVAENVRGQKIRVGGEPESLDRIDLPVESGVYENAGLVEGVVTLAHASGEAVQAKYGALTKAAAQAGLHVHGGSR